MNPSLYALRHLLGMQYKTSLKSNLLAILINQITTENNTHSHAQDTTAFQTTVSLIELSVTGQ